MSNTHGIVATIRPRRTGWAAVLAGALVVTLVIGLAGPASAKSATTGGSALVHTEVAPAPQPCSGDVGCIPQPPPSPPDPGPPPPGRSGGSSGSDAECLALQVVPLVGSAVAAVCGITVVIRTIEVTGFNALVGLFGQIFFTTPTVNELPRVGQLWNSSWQLMLTIYGMLILIAAIVVMTYQTLQTRITIKEIVPRIVVGFLAGTLSLWVGTQAIELANAFARAFLAGGVDPNSVGPNIGQFLLNSVSAGLFTLVLGVVLLVLIVGVALTYVVRVGLTLVLLAAAPLLLMFHVLPQTEGIAKWWWKAFGGCLAIQLVQSFTFITAIRLLTSPGNSFLDGSGGVVDILVALALTYVLYKIPFWIFASLRIGGGRSFLGPLARAVIAYKTFGLLRGGTGAGAARVQASSPPPVDPYARPRATASGQYLLPLEGLRRVRRSTPPHLRYAPPPRRRARPAGTQLALPLGRQWPEHRPRLGRDGQYRLPITAPRTRRPPATAKRDSGSRNSTAPPTAQWDGQAKTGRAPRRARQLSLPLELPRTAPPRPNPRKEGDQK